MDIQMEKNITYDIGIINYVIKKQNGEMNTNDGLQIYGYFY